MIPPDDRAGDFDRRVDEIGEATAQAIRDTGVSQVVFLSSLGAELPSGTGPILGLHRQEERLKQISGIHLLILRAAYFFENHFGSLPIIKHQGINGGAIAPDVSFPMIATRDIGQAAAAALAARDFQGVNVCELLGQRDLTMRGVTRILGEKIGRPDLPCYGAQPSPGLRTVRLRSLARESLRELRRTGSWPCGLSNLVMAPDLWR